MVPQVRIIILCFIFVTDILLGNRIERCLSYDEKPLLLFQKLKDAKKNPVFMLKHIKDIRSPIAVAQQKQAARKASSESSSVKSPPLTGTSTLSQGQDSQSHDRTHPPKLQVNSHVGSIAPQIMTSGPHAQSGWPEIMSPAVESKDRADDFASTGAESSRAQSTLSTVAGTATTDGTESTAATSTREIPLSTGVSYAVAIYPYMAEQEDEFDVVV